VRPRAAHGESAHGNEIEGVHDVHEDDGRVVLLRQLDPELDGVT
jgi:hypothetical protein